VLRVRTGPHVLLLSGDVERPAEAEILADGRLDAVDVLLVPHHGSRTSSSAWFVATTQPRWALVAAGHRNRWGFPRPEVTARWEQAGARVLVTSQTGAVEFELDPRRPLEPPQLWRTELRRPWRDP
jgi:competence protein ComEC